MHQIRSKVIAILATVGLLLGGAISAAPAPQPSDESGDASQIAKVFADYKRALLRGDGARAADVVSAQTIAFYDGMLNHALNTPRADLSELDFLSKFIVLRVRHEFTRSQISGMTGRDLLELGVVKGWISKTTVTNIAELVDIQVMSSSASASVPGASGVPLFHFAKESGKWKLDLVASFALANIALKQEVVKSGLTEEQFIVRLLKVLSSREVDDRVFSPPTEQ